jgi:hypothetical protein
MRYTSIGKFCVWALFLSSVSKRIQVYVKVKQTFKGQVNVVLASAVPPPATSINARIILRKQ